MFEHHQDQQAPSAPSRERFRAYLDESEDAATGFYVVGGFIAEATVWQHLEPEWLNCLPKGLATFHATDCFTGNKEFRYINIPERVLLLDRLTDVIVCHGIKLLGYGIDANTFKGYSPRTLANDFLGNKYAAPFGGVIDLACHAMRRLPGPEDFEILENGDNWERCSFFIEKNKYSHSAERTLSSMRGSNRLWYRNRLGKAVYGTKSGPGSIPLLQVADLGAFLAAKKISKSPEGKISWKPYLEKLTSARCFYRMVLADKYSVDVLYKTYAELKERPEEYDAFE